MELKSLLVLHNDNGDCFIRVRTFDGRSISWKCTTNDTTWLAAKLQEVMRPYSSAELRVQRTRSRVIYRFLKLVRAQLTSGFVQGGLMDGSGATLHRKILLCSNGHRVYDYDSLVRLMDYPPDWDTREQIERLISSCRMHGDRPTRQGVSVARQAPPKPSNFKRVPKTHYHGKSMAQYAPSQIDGLKVGIEMEFSSTRGVEFDESYISLQDDSSLPSAGGECITRPDSIDSHIRLTKEFLDYNQRKLTVNDQCGNHYHVDKRHVNGSVDKIARRIFAYSDKKYMRIAGREPNRFCRRGSGRDHFSAINTSNDYTVEFRMFSGTKSAHKIKRRLQWINALIAWGNKMHGEASPLSEQPPVTDWPSLDNWLILNNIGRSYV